MRQRIIQGRVRHLESEIRAFKDNIDKIEGPKTWTDGQGTSVTVNRGDPSATEPALLKGDNATVVYPDGTRATIAIGDNPALAEQAAPTVGIAQRGQPMRYSNESTPMDEPGDTGSGPEGEGEGGGDGGGGAAGE